MKTKQKILKFLTGGGITSVLEAVTMFGTIDLRKYISMLRSEGHNINGDWETNPVTGKRFKCYYLMGGVR